MKTMLVMVLFMLIMDLGLARVTTPSRSDKYDFEIHDAFGADLEDDDEANFQPLKPVLFGRPVRLSDKSDEFDVDLTIPFRNNRVQEELEKNNDYMNKLESFYDALANPKKEIQRLGSRSHDFDQVLRTQTPLPFKPSLPDPYPHHYGAYGYRRDKRARHLMSHPDIFMPKRVETSNHHRLETTPSNPWSETKALGPPVDPTPAYIINPEPESFQPELQDFPNEPNVVYGNWIALDDEANHDQHFMDDGHGDEGVKSSIGTEMDFTDLFIDNQHLLNSDPLSGNLNQDPFSLSKDEVARKRRRRRLKEKSRLQRLAKKTRKNNNKRRKKRLLSSSNEGPSFLETLGASKDAVDHELHFDEPSAFPRRFRTNNIDNQDWHRFSSTFFDDAQDRLRHDHQARGQAEERQSVEINKASVIIDSKVDSELPSPKDYVHSSFQRGPNFGYEVGVHHGQAFSYQTRNG